MGTIYWTRPFLPHYPAVVRHRNLLPFLQRPGMRFYRVDLRTDPLDELLAGAEVLFHLAGLPGTQTGMNLESYWECNVLATRKLLEAVDRCALPLQRFVFASTLAIYGHPAPTGETIIPAPVSPCGITKLAAEQLCQAYAQSRQIPLVTLRYASVYGPRQRPDMDYYRLIQAILEDRVLSLSGDSQPLEGDVYVADCVQATLAAWQAPVGAVYHVGSGKTVRVGEVLPVLERLAGRKLRVRRKPACLKPSPSPAVDWNKLCQPLGWTPQTSLEEGLARQWHWQSRQPSQSPFRDLCSAASR